MPAGSPQGCRGPGQLPGDEPAPVGVWGQPLNIFLCLNRIERKIATISLDSKSSPKSLENGEYRALPASGRQQ